MNEYVISTCGLIAFVFHDVKMVAVTEWATTHMCVRQLEICSFLSKDLSCARLTWVVIYFIPAFRHELLGIMIHTSFRKRKVFLVYLCGLYVRQEGRITMY
jgi:hypothetical protein